jgi:hypothetical protein
VRQRDRRPPIPIDGVVGALHARRDIRVDPRRAVAGLASLLEQDPGARVLWNAHVHAAKPGRVDADDVAVRAPLAIFCPPTIERCRPNCARVARRSRCAGCRCCGSPGRAAAAIPRRF